MASAAHSKAPVSGWVPSAPKAPAKHPERALPSPGSAQWDPLQKRQSIECSGGSLGVNWRIILINMIIIGSSEDVNLAMVLLMSVCTQVGSVGGSDLEGAAGWCWCGSAHAERWITQQKDFLLFHGFLQPCCTVLTLMLQILLLSSVRHAKVPSFPNSVPLLKPKLKIVTLMLFHFPLVVLFCLFPCFEFSLWLWFLWCIGKFCGSSAQTLLLGSDLKQNKREREKGGDCLLVTEQLVCLYWKRD